MRSISVLAFDIATSFDIATLRPQAEKWGKIVERSPLIIEFSDERYAAIFDYGSAVFFGFTATEARKVLDKLKTYASRTNRREFTDHFTLYIGDHSKQRVTTESLTIHQFFLDTVKLVAIVLSRSVGLEYYEDLIDRNLAKLEETVDKLAREGRFVLNRRSLIKQAGLALAIHHELAYNLELLDVPDVLWEKGAEMQKLYEHLSSQFAILRRSQAIERKLDIIGRSSEFIIERLQDRTANLMEWAVIVLFVIDVVLIYLEIASR